MEGAGRRTAAGERRKIGIGIGKQK